MNYTNPSKAEWRRAVDATCKACIHDPAEAGTWRQQTTLCTVSECPLWAVRPVSHDRIALENADLGANETANRVIARAGGEK